MHINVVMFAKGTVNARYHVVILSILIRLWKLQNQTIQHFTIQLKLALNEQYIKTIRKVNLPKFTPAKLHCIFGVEQIEQILKHCEHIFSEAQRSCRKTFLSGSRG